MTSSKLDVYVIEIGLVAAVHGHFGGDRASVFLLPLLPRVFPFVPLPFPDQDGDDDGNGEHQDENDDGDDEPRVVPVPKAGCWLPGGSLRGRGNRGLWSGKLHTVNLTVTQPVKAKHVYIHMWHKRYW